MNENHLYLRVVVPLALSNETRALVLQSDGRASDAQPASSTADPLNAPVTGGDIQAAAVVITAVFTAADAALTFFGRLRALTKERSGRGEVMNSKTNIRIELNGDDDPSGLIG